MIELKPFSPDGDAAAFHVRVDLRRSSHILTLEYRIEGPGEKLRWPSPATPGYREGLWEHTCCELFVKAPFGDAYWEWNLSPSGEWAFFGFDAYRIRNEHAWPLGHRGPLSLTADAKPGDRRISCQLNLANLSSGSDWALMNELPLQIAPTCVLEHADGTKSYWAVSHPCEKPDFHRY